MACKEKYSSLALCEKKFEIFLSSFLLDDDKGIENLCLVYRMKQYTK